MKKQLLVLSVAFLTVIVVAEAPRDTYFENRTLTTIDEVFNEIEGFDQDVETAQGPFFK